MRSGQLVPQDFRLGPGAPKAVRQAVDAMRGVIENGEPPVFIVWLHLNYLKPTDDAIRALPYGGAARTRGRARSWFVERLGDFVLALRMGGVPHSAIVDLVLSASSPTWRPFPPVPNDVLRAIGYAPRPWLTGGQLELELKNIRWRLDDRIRQLHSRAAKLHKVDRNKAGGDRRDAVRYVWPICVT